MNKKILIIGAILSFLLISSVINVTAINKEKLETNKKTKDPIFGIAKIEGSDDLKASDNKPLALGNTIFSLITFNLDITIFEGNIVVGDNGYNEDDELTIGLFIGRRGQEDATGGHYLINGIGFNIT